MNCLREFSDVFQKVLFGEAVLTINLIKWMHHRSFSISSVKDLTVFPSFLRKMRSRSGTDAALVSSCLNEIVSLSTADSIRSGQDMVELGYLLSRCSSLQKLSISRYATESVVRTIADNCPFLTSCSLHFENTYDHEVFARLCMKCTKLEHLAMTRRPTNIDMMCILVHCRSLKTLTVTNAQVFSLNFFLIHFRGEFIAKEVYWPANIVRLLLLTQSSRLQYVSTMTSLWREVPVGLLCPNLVELNLHSIEDGIVNLNHFLKEVPNLRVFDLRTNYSLLNDETLLTMALSCKEVRSLTLRSLRYASVGTLRTLFTALTQLSSLLLKNVPASSHTMEVLSVLTHHPTLTFLSVQSSALKSDELDSLCPHLQKVNALLLDSGEFIGDTNLTSIAVNCYLLTEFKCNNSQFIRDSGILKLMQCCGGTLRVLDLANCTRITDDSIASLTTFGGRLRHLNIMRCQRISLDGVVALVSSMRLLRKLFTSYYEEFLRKHASEDLDFNPNN